MSQIRPEFKYHTLNEAGVQACLTIRAGFSELLNVVEMTSPAGRPRAVAVTKLQEACNWAVRAVAEQSEYQSHPPAPPEPEGEPEGAAAGDRAAS